MDPNPQQDQTMTSGQPSPGLTDGSISQQSMPAQPANEGMMATTMTQSSPVSPPPAQPSTDDQLVQIKNRALADLAPLVETLEQTPEERFHTVMMLLQATDDKSMLQKAYDAANSITDSKHRAQALLDVVNEANYLAKQQSSGQ